MGCHNLKKQGKTKQCQEKQLKEKQTHFSFWVIKIEERKGLPYQGLEHGNGNESQEEDSNKLSHGLSYKAKPFFLGLSKHQKEMKRDVKVREEGICLLRLERVPS
jgi:thioredoxin-related protein